MERHLSAATVGALALVAAAGALLLASAEAEAQTRPDLEVIEFTPAIVGHVDRNATWVWSPDVVLFRVTINNTVPGAQNEAQGNTTAGDGVNADCGTTPAACTQGARNTSLDGKFNVTLTVKACPATGAPCPGTGTQYFAETKRDQGPLGGGRNFTLEFTWNTATSSGGTPTGLLNVTVEIDPNGEMLRGGTSGEENRGNNWATRFAIANEGPQLVASNLRWSAANENVVHASTDSEILVALTNSGSWNYSDPNNRGLSRGVQTLVPEQFAPEYRDPPLAVNFTITPTGSGATPVRKSTLVGLLGIKDSGESVSDIDPGDSVDVLLVWNRTLSSGRFVAGNVTIDAVVDPTANSTEGPTGDPRRGDNTVTGNFRIKASDLTGTIRDSDLRNLSEPYALSGPSGNNPAGGSVIRFDVTVKNHGDHPAGGVDSTSGSGNAFFVAAYLGEVALANRKDLEGPFTMAAGAQITVHLEVGVAATGPNVTTPGLKTIVVVVDSGTANSVDDQVHESKEDNNNDVAAVCVGSQACAAPVNVGPRIHVLDAGAVGSDGLFQVRSAKPNETTVLRVRVQSASGTVTGGPWFTIHTPSGLALENSTIRLDPDRKSGEESFKDPTLYFFNFTFVNASSPYYLPALKDDGAFEYWVYAEDAQGLNVSATKTVTVTRFGKKVENENAANNTSPSPKGHPDDFYTQSFQGSHEFNWTFAVLDTGLKSGTGGLDDWNSTDGKQVRVTGPGGMNRTFVPQALGDCDYSPAAQGTRDTVRCPTKMDAPLGGIPLNSRLFRFSTKGQPDFKFENIGEYNFSFLVTDAIGKEGVKILAGDLLDTDPPTFNDVNTSLPAKDALLEMGDDIVFRVAGKDNHTFGGVRMNVTRPNGEIVVYDFAVATLDPVENGKLPRGNGTYQLVLGTGLGKNLTSTGTYRFQVGIYDNKTVGSYGRTFGSFRFLPLTPINLTDRRDPEINITDVSPGDDQELNLNATITARVRDPLLAGNVTLRVLDATTRAVLLDLTMDKVTEDGDLYRANFSFDRVVDLTLEVEARDSAGHVAAKSVAYRFVENRGPSFPTSKVSPPPDGFGGVRPIIRFVAQDGNGVNLSSIVVRVDSTEVVHTATDLGAGEVRVEVAIQQPYEHGDVVVVNATAKDRSVLELVGAREWSFKIDGLQPTVNATSSPSIPGSGGARIVAPSTEFTLTGADADSGVSGLAWQLVRNDDAPPAFEPYTGPFRFPTGSGEGSWLLRTSAIDAAGNLATPGPVPLVLDGGGPTITHDPATGVVHDETGSRVTVTATDSPAGVDRVTLVWRSGTGPDATLVLEEVPESTQWRATIPALPRGTSVSYSLVAFDRLANEARRGPFTFSAANHVPTIEISTPADNATVNGTVPVRWLASDPDNDPLTIDVLLRELRDPEFLPHKTNLSNTGALTIDTREDLLDGVYELKIVATDGLSLSEDVVRIRVLNQRDAIGTGSFSSTTAEKGETVTLSVKLNKAATKVEARIFRDGDLVTVLPMRDDGTNGDVTARDGTFTAQMTVADSGTYSATVVAEFTDGTTDQRVGVTSVEVESSVGERFSAHFAEWVVLLILFALVAGFAVYGLGRRT